MNPYPFLTFRPLTHIDPTSLRYHNDLINTPTTGDNAYRLTPHGAKILTHVVDYLTSVRKFAELQCCLVGCDSKKQARIKTKFVGQIFLEMIRLSYINHLLPRFVHVENMSWAEEIHIFGIRLFKPSSLDAYLTLMAKKP